MLYSEWLKIWLEEKKNYIKESTYANYSTIIHSYILPTLGDKILIDITELLVQRMILVFMQNKRLSCSTAKNVVMIIKSSLRAAQKANLVVPVVIDIRYPKAQAHNVPRILSKEEQSRLVQSSYLNLNAKSLGLLLALSTGIRIGELCGLKWDDISLTDQTITIRRTLQRIYDPGAKTKTKVVIGEPKTLSSRRIVPISTTILPLLHRLCKEDGNSYVLSGSHHYIEPRTYREYFSSILKRSGIQHINFHALRHTFATRLIENGADYKTVSSILGHSSINMTLNLYVHPQLSQQRSVVEMFSLVG